MRAATEAGPFKKRDLFMSIRVAISGRTVSTPLFETMQVIGRERSLARLEAAVAALRRPA